MPADEPRQLLAAALDIETAPLPDDELWRIVGEIDLPPHPGTFCRSDVRTGNLRDPDKIIEKIRIAEIRHKEKEAAWEAACQRKKEGVQERAALSPVTGRVVAVGWLLAWEDGEEECVIQHIDENNGERQLLEDTWRRIVVLRNEDPRPMLLTWDGQRFDLPFLLVRAWAHGLTVPYLRNRYGWEDWLVDLRRHLTVSGAVQGPSGLDAVSKAFGLPGKFEDVDGADFHRVLVEDPEAALAYLRRDVELVIQLAQRMGILA